MVGLDGEPWWVDAPINARSKGLVIIAGCAQAGTVNTGNHAKEFRGADDIRAILGEFHFFGPPDRGVQCMVEEIHVTGPRVVVPMH